MNGGETKAKELHFTIQAPQTTIRTPNPAFQPLLLAVVHYSRTFAW